MHSITEKGSNILKNMHFGLNGYFQEFSNFSESSGLILLVPLAVWKLLIWNKLLILSRNDFKGPLNAVIILNLDNF